MFYIVNTDEESVSGPIPFKSNVIERLEEMDEDERETRFVLTLHDDATASIEQAETFFESEDGDDEDEDDE